LDVESTVFGLTGLVDFEGVAEPVVGFSGGDKLGGAEGVAGEGKSEKKKERTSQPTRRTSSHFVSWTYEMFSNESTKQ